MDSTEGLRSIDSEHTLRQAHTREEMDAILDVIWAANYTPYEPFAQLFFPVLGFQPSDRDDSIAESKERFWNFHQSDSGSNWYYVEYVPTGKAVGCAQWEVRLENPFPNGPPNLTAPWWPNGEHREFCELILNQVYKPRAHWMTRPHLALNWMAVHPAHRRRGVGSLLMQVGIQRADQLNLEAWMEASVMGKPVYEKFGFRSLFKMAFDTEKNNASDQWHKMEHEMTPQPFFVMWRPKQGSWEEVIQGVTRKVDMPWVRGIEQNMG
ncbi:hypothetical protein CC78DRAFT_565162 [Lojkania enalia]|uniref:N-acetyltransferase domain-containing protein n=1 Tax=Lojkania enalia TaxID=147567 RepID=A0A9P4KHE1_9PLEO|nr:hypothetical protein CC78DRAFT_565162 [Didymosphaeria enalia]